MLPLANWQRVLMFFAHPDDETLAAGGTIAKLCRLGVEVSVAIPATGITSRRNQGLSAPQMDEDLKHLRADCEAAMRVLGVAKDKIYLGNFPDNEMDKHSRLELNHWLEDIVGKVKPDVVFTHHRFCTNIDHQYCHEAAVVATRSSVHSHIALVAGEVPSSTGYLKPTQFEPNFYVELSREDLEKKVRSMETYKGEARPDPHPRSREVLEALAKVRGSESGFYFAEAFVIQKCFS